MPERSDVEGPSELPGLSLDGRVERDAFVLVARLAASAGEVVGIVGEVGSGKSTLLGVLAGRLRLASGGLVGPDGVWDDPAAGRWRPEAERPVAYLPPRPTLAEDIAAIDQVIEQAGGPPMDRSGGRSGGQAGVSAAERAAPGPAGPSSEDRRAAEAMLEALGLAPGVYRRDGWTLSGGETQRVALARCFIASAAVVILDDPLAALDGRTRATVRQWLAGQLARRSAIVVLACSDPADTHLLADRLLPLD